MRTGAKKHGYASVLRKSRRTAMELVTTPITERQRKFHETSPYEIGLDRNAANYVPLTPLGFLQRSAAVFPDRAAVVYGERHYSWREAYHRCRQLAAALAAQGVGRGDTVALMAPN